MLRRLWAWLVGTGHTRDGYYWRVEGQGGDAVEVGVKTWAELCVVAERADWLKCLSYDPPAFDPRTGSGA
jgi:hypothetical protein